MRGWIVGLNLISGLTFGPTAWAIELPPPPADPQLAQTLVQAQALLEKASVAGFMDAPDPSKPWPCQVSELQLRKYAAALSTDEEREQHVKRPRAAIAMSSTIRDVSYAPIVAACKGGKLDGPLEFVIDFTKVTETQNSIFETHIRTRRILIVSAGTADEEAGSSISLITHPKYTYKDPAMQARMGQSAPTYTKLTATYSQAVPLGHVHTVIQETRAANDTRSWQTILIWPTAPRRDDVLVYDGASLSSSSHQKDGLTHGEYRAYPSRRNGVDFPGSTTCYEDGDLIKTETCDVD